LTAYIVSRATLGGTPKRFSPSSLVYFVQPVSRTFLKCKHPQVKSLSFLGSIHSSFAVLRPYLITVTNQALLFSMYRCCSPIVWLPIVRLATASYRYFTSSDSKMQAETRNRRARLELAAVWCRTRRRAGGSLYRTSRLKRDGLALMRLRLQPLALRIGGACDRQILEGALQIGTYGLSIAFV
jgi:hypothetical protein